MNKYFTLIEASLFFKEKKYEKREFLLDRNHKLTLVNGKQYQYLVQGPEVNFQSPLSNNYTEMLEECSTFLNKYKLITKGKANTITITNNIFDFSVGEQEKSSFSFDSLLGEKELVKGIEKLTERDIDEIILNDNLEKGSVSNGIMTLVMKQGTTYQREYNRLTFIGLLVKYIEVLIENKKSLNTLVINNTVSLYFQTKAQNLGIAEGEENTYTAGGDVEGYIDSNLINSSFVLCSLSDLVIDKTRLKMWLNKVIINTEVISKFYFN